MQTDTSDGATGVIESHYLETIEGLFFAVKGLVHPPDRYLACLRYAPDPLGDRQAGGRRYRRLYHFAEQEALLSTAFPHYLAFDPVCQATLQSVPLSHIRRVLDPRARLQALHTEPALDPVAADAVAFAGLLAAEAGVPGEAFGVSGSLLIGLHTPASDLDVTVYGRQAGRAVQAALQRLFATGARPEVRRLDGRGVEALYAERSADTRMPFADFQAAERSKINQGEYGGRPYFLRFVLAPAEIGEQYGDVTYAPAGRAEIVATVTDAGSSLFTPCVYPVSGVEILAGSRPADLREIVSFRGRFCEQAQAGDRVRARGAVESVQHRRGERWQRLLLGNAVDDVMFLEG